MNHRIDKEIEEIKSLKNKEGNNNYTIEIEYNANGSVFKITIKTLSFKVKLEEFQAYPFRPPKVKFLKDDLYLYRINFISSYLHLINISEKCLCCKSILCNWGPMNNILHIMEEIDGNYEINIKIRNSILCKKICEKHIPGIDGIHFLIYSFIF
jgi:ubiquitin-protein ligase